VNNGDFYEDLDGPSAEKLIDALARGETPPKGSVTGRQGSAPAGGPKTLLETK
jgi:NADH-quinone oxidoreductase subunit E